MENKHDAVNRPEHYTDGKIEVIDFIEDKKLGYNLGNSVKYISRAGKKNPEKRVEDLEKARWYLDREIGRLKDIFKNREKVILPPEGLDKKPISLEDVFNPGKQREAIYRSQIERKNYIAGIGPLDEHYGVDDRNDFYKKELVSNAFEKTVDRLNEMRKDLTSYSLEEMLSKTYGPSGTLGRQEAERKIKAIANGFDRK